MNQTLQSKAFLPSVYGNRFGSGARAARPLLCFRCCLLVVQWHGKKTQAVAQLIKWLQEVGVPSVKGNRRGGTALGQQPVQPASKKWAAQTRIGWHCPLCKYFNVCFRIVCFQCKVEEEAPRI
eukprot:6275930-Amphidinium_carterae.1